jgi:hypothetical protein
VLAHHLRQHDPSLPVRSVTATRGKFLRAEPVAAAYERGVVFHCGVFGKLEDQLCALVSDFDARAARSGENPAAPCPPTSSTSSGERSRLERKRRLHVKPMRQLSLKLDGDELRVEGVRLLAERRGTLNVRARHALGAKPCGVNRLQLLAFERRPEHFGDENVVAGLRDAERPTFRSRLGCGDEDGENHKHGRAVTMTPDCAQAGTNQELLLDRLRRSPYCRLCWRWCGRRKPPLFSIPSSL